LSALELVLSSADLGHLWIQMKLVFFIAGLIPLVIPSTLKPVLFG
jgi:hypothetical protein